MMRTGASVNCDKNSLYAGYYEALKNSFPDYPSPNFHQIDLDLRRTFADEPNSFF